MLASFKLCNPWTDLAQTLHTGYAIPDFLENKPPGRIFESLLENTPRAYFPVKNYSDRVKKHTTFAAFSRKYARGLTKYACYITVRHDFTIKLSQNTRWKIEIGCVYLLYWIIECIRFTFWTICLLIIWKCYFYVLEGKILQFLHFSKISPGRILEENVEAWKCYFS